MRLEAALKPRYWRWALNLSERRWMIVLSDVPAVVLAAGLALVFWSWTDHRAVTLAWIQARVAWIPILTGLWVVMAFLTGAYAPPEIYRPERRWEVPLRTGLLVALTYILLYFAAPRTLLPRLVIVIFVILAVGGTVALRWGMVHLAHTLPLRRNVLIVGAAEVGQSLAELLLDRPELGYRVVGFIDDDGAKRDLVIEVRGNHNRSCCLSVLGTSEDMPTLVRALGVHEIVLAIRGKIELPLFQSLLTCSEQGVTITPAVTLYEHLTGRVPVAYVGENWNIALPFQQPGAGLLYPMLKRWVDVVGASLGLLFFGLLLPWLALAIKLDSPGPVFYRQVRVGQGGRPFVLWKLRTMRADAEADGRAVWTQEEDPRITRVGRWLRKARLDEFLQFLNILRGEMSAVGPRPERPELVAELEKQIPFYRLRHAVKPGMAGWAMIHYDYVDSLEDAQVRLEYDLYYIKHQSIWLDLQILLRAAFHLVALKGR